MKTYPTRRRSPTTSSPIHVCSASTSATEASTECSYQSLGTTETSTETNGRSEEASERFSNPVWTEEEIREGSKNCPLHPSPWDWMSSNNKERLYFEISLTLKIIQSLTCFKIFLNCNVFWMTRYHELSLFLAIFFPHTLFYTYEAPKKPFLN